MEPLDADVCYRALATRDARFDGTFFTAVKTTGIYCRPICPARTPKRENCAFHPSAASAQAAGFRPCLRCRPELAPGVAAARGTASTVARALRLIDGCALDDAGVDRLAERLGVSGRHLRRLFEEHLGASPIAVARARRALFAKRLLVDTQIPITEIAYASGFGSVRRFNDEMQRTFHRPPRELRKERKTDRPGITLSLAYRPPFDWDAAVAFLAGRAIRGIEEVSPEAYRRSFVLNGRAGRLVVQPSGRNYLLATIETADTSCLDAVVARLRALFDLDADPVAIGGVLAADPRLAPLIAKRPAMRVPGAWDPFEMGVRAILGQQVSVKAATTLTGRLVDRLGVNIDGILTFPPADALAVANLDGLGITGGRIRALRSFAGWWAQSGALPATLDAIVSELAALDGLGPWTAHYIAMRSREPDAFPATDLAVKKAWERLGGAPLTQASENWRPWRAYAVLHLWASLADPETT